MVNGINKIGGITLVDPIKIATSKNRIGNYEPTPLDNVNPEDLSILVELETETKNRTILVGGGDNISRIGNTVKFIGGSNYAGKKSLTTNYTDLIVLGSEDANPEALGITNIDINFTSSYAPQIVINFVDIRGAAIFQSMENNNSSPFDVFFNLPYPLFKLTVKGFYGKPVTYCLHLVKWNSKFNSNTGNFEITANFIGYTYAILTDMLMGYIRSITETSIGSEIFRLKKQADPSLITLNELLLKIGDINKEIELLISKGEADNLAKINQVIGLLEDFKRLTNQTKTKISDPSTSGQTITDYNLSVKNIFEQIGNSETAPQDINSTNPDFKSHDEKYNTLINKYNILKNTATTNLSTKIISVINQKLSDSGNLTFTIGDIVKLLVVHGEIFFESLAEVARLAESSTSRKNELQKLINTSKNNTYNIKNEDNNIYAWPEYRKLKYNNNIESYVEEYIGNETTIDLSKIDEIKFIDDMMDAMIKTRELENLVESRLDNVNEHWRPVNPLEVILPNTSNPYQAIQNESNEFRVIRAIILRAIVFLGYTYEDNDLTDEVIKKMASYEAINVFSNVLNKENINSILSAILQKYNNDPRAFIDDLKKQTDESVLGSSVIFTDSDNLKYNYINNPEPIFQSVALPLNPIDTESLNTISNNFKIRKNVDNLKVLREENDFYFFSNVISDSGSTYVKIIDELPPDFSLINTEEYVKVDELTTGNSNIFNNPYGVFYNQFLEDGTTPNQSLYYFDSKNNVYYNGITERRTGKASIFDIYNLKDGKNYDKIIISGTSSEIYLPLINEQYGLRNLNNITRNSLLLDNQKLSYPYNNISYKISNIQISNQPFVIFTSLFGSELYYRQETEYAKAFLFLHTIPHIILNKDFNSSIIDTSGINYLPKSFVYFIGGLLYREKNEIIEIGDIYNNKFNFVLPELNQYFSSKSYNFELSDSQSNYVNIDSSIIQLPEQVKTEFINQFEFFVNGEWTDLKNNLEIIVTSNTNNLTNFKNKHNDIFKSVNITNTPYDILKKYGPNNVSTTVFNQNEEQNVAKVPSRTKKIYTNIFYNKLKEFSNIEQYQTLTPFYYFDVQNPIANFSGDIFLELRDGSEANIALIEFIKGTKILINSTYKTFRGVNVYKKDIIVKESKLNTYLASFYFKLNELTKNYNTLEKEEERKKDLFNTIDNKIIKFNMYRTFSSIYNKWIAGTSSQNIFFQCNTQNINGNNRSLFDTFKFIDRAYNDISNKFYLNPRLFTDILLNNWNMGLQDLLSRMLSDNNFEFIPLPNFIDLTKDDELKSLFTPFTYKESLQVKSLGPSYICVYIGQGSTNLDIKNGVYPNDGFDIRENKIPPDFNTDSIIPVTAFNVDYGVSNQSIFKDIRLDQSEFTETAESIQISDDIANNGLQTNSTYIGQNLFNVFQIRSYKAEVEMMGNAMIQPILYFQLNNIPMFHGAYLITTVKHSIQPNYMTTTFSGVRIKYTNTPLVDEQTIAMNLIGSLTTRDVSNVLITTEVDNNTTPNATGCKVPNKPFKPNEPLIFYDIDNPTPITTTDITKEDLIQELNKLKISVVRKRITYTVAVLEQSKGDKLRAFGNNLFGIQAEDNFPGANEFIKNGKILHTFCYRDSEKPRVFPQFDNWVSSLDLFANYRINRAFIDANRVKKIWETAPITLNFFNNGIKEDDDDDTQLIKFVVLYYVNWNAPDILKGLLNHINNSTTPNLSKYTENGITRTPQTVYNIYKQSISLFP